MWYFCILQWRFYIEIHVSYDKCTWAFYQIWMTYICLIAFVRRSESLRILARTDDSRHLCSFKYFPGQKHGASSEVEQWDMNWLHMGCQRCKQRIKLPQNYVGPWHFYFIILFILHKFSNLMWEGSSYSSFAVILTPVDLWWYQLFHSWY